MFFRAKLRDKLRGSMLGNKRGDVSLLIAVVVAGIAILTSVYMYTGTTIKSKEVKVSTLQSAGSLSNVSALSVVQSLTENMSGSFSARIFPDPYPERLSYNPSSDTSVGKVKPTAADVNLNPANIDFIDASGNKIPANSNGRVSSVIVKLPESSTLHSADPKQIFAPVGNTVNVPTRWDSEIQFLKYEFEDSSNPLLVTNALVEVKSKITEGQVGERVVRNRAYIKMGNPPTNIDCSLDVSSNASVLKPDDKIDINLKGRGIITNADVDDSVKNGNQYSKIRTSFTLNENSKSLSANFNSGATPSQIIGTARVGVPAVSVPPVNKCAGTAPIDIDATIYSPFKVNNVDVSNTCTTTVNVVTRPACTLVPDRSQIKTDGETVGFTLNCHGLVDSMSIEGEEKPYNESGSDCLKTIRRELTLNFNDQKQLTIRGQAKGPGGVIDVAAIVSLEICKFDDPNYSEKVYYSGKTPFDLYKRDKNYTHNGFEVRKVTGIATAGKNGHEWENWRSCPYDWCFDAKNPPGKKWADIYGFIKNPGTTGCSLHYTIRYYGCFAPNTLITMADGSKRYIGDITDQDSVWNPVKEKAYRVKKIVSGPEEPRMYEISVLGNKVEVTETHPMVTRYGIKQAKDLSSSDMLLANDGKYYKMDSYIHIEQRDDQVVWNLELDVNEEEASDPRARMLEANGIVTGDLKLQELLETDK